MAAACWADRCRCRCESRLTAACAAPSQAQAQSRRSFIHTASVTPAAKRARGDRSSRCCPLPVWSPLQSSIVPCLCLFSHLQRADYTLRPSCSACRQLSSEAALLVRPLQCSVHCPAASSLHCQSSAVAMVKQINVRWQQPHAYAQVIPHATIKVQARLPCHAHIDPIDLIPLPTLRPPQTPPRSASLAHPFLTPPPPSHPHPPAPPPLPSHSSLSRLSSLTSQLSSLPPLPLPLLTPPSPRSPTSPLSTTPTSSTTSTTSPPPPPSTPQSTAFSDPTTPDATTSTPHLNPTHTRQTPLSQPPPQPPPLHTPHKTSNRPP